MQATVANPASSTPATARTGASSRTRTRGFVELLTLLVGFFILQTGLAPFDFLRPHQSAAARDLFTVSMDRVTRPDILSNVFLYFPLGLLLSLSLTQRLRRPRVAAFFAVSAAGMLSLVIEGIQFFCASRVSSLIDVTANGVGAGLGVLVNGFVAPILPRLTGAVRTEFVLRPQGTLLKCYVGVLCIAATAPFDFSPDVGHLKRSWRSAGSAIFHTAGESTSTGASAAPGSPLSIHERWSRQKQWARWAAEGVSFLVFGWLTIGWLHQEYGFGRSASVMLCLWLGSFFACALSVLQFPILSRGFDTTDVMARMFGLFVGTLAVIRTNVGTSAGQAAFPARRDTGFVKLLCLACGLYIAYTGIIPFGVDLSKAIAALSWSTVVPFYTYPYGRFNFTTTDAMEKLGSYMLFAVLVVSLHGNRRHTSLRARLRETVLGCVALASAIEIVQCVIPPRTPSLTDVLLAGTGAFLGVVLQARFDRFRVETARRRAKLSAAAAPPTSPAKVFTRLDDLIASLAEPQPNAPSETSARPSPAPDEANR